MSTIIKRYIEVTRDAKQSIQDRPNTGRSAEEERVYTAFRKKARDAYSTLRAPGNRS